MSCIDVSANSSPFFVPGTLVHRCLWPFHTLPVCTGCLRPGTGAVCGADGTMQPLRPVSSDHKKQLSFLKGALGANPCCLSAASAPFWKVAMGQVKTSHSWSSPLTHGSPGTTAGHSWSTPLSASPSGINSWAVQLCRTAGDSSHSSHNMGCATAVGVGWLPALPAPAKAPRLAYKPGARGALSPQRR